MTLPRLRALGLLASTLACGCAAKATESTDVASQFDSAIADTAGDTAVDDGGFTAEVAPVDAPPEVVAKVYANTDDSLYEMDPTTKDVVLIGKLTGLDATKTEHMTDIAVDADGNVFGISEFPSTGGGNVYQFTLPASAGPVTLTKKRALPATVHYFALAFAPKGVLGSDEALVAGDGAGTLWYVPTDGSAPTKVGDFGTVAAGDPGGGSAGQSWQLSGDIAFFSNAGTPVGIATIRPCTGTTCNPDNDVVVEIDMTALATKNPKANLKKRFLGSASGFGRLYGIGAWNDQVYAFQRFSGSATSGNPATLISISLVTGKGTSLKDFPDITAAKNGWSGAGVTTAAKISLPK
jgi:hypothetical protein